MAKRFLTALLAAALVLVGAAGCSKPDDENIIEISIEEEESSALTPEEKIAQHNEKITDADYTLVQFQKTSGPVAVMETTEGAIRMQLYPEQAPKAVENFIQLSKDGYYNGVTFHRIIRDFVIQGGDPTGTGTGGESIYAGEDNEKGYFEDEFSLDLWHFRGAVSMAKVQGEPDTNASQFFIVQKDFVERELLEKMEEIRFPDKVIQRYKEKGGAPHLDSEYTVFGMVMDEESMEVVDAIAAVDVEDRETGKPLESVLIESITIEED